MRIGLLRHRITFQRATDADNDFGEPIPSWATLATVWARVEPLEGNEQFAALQVQSEVDHRILVRYQSTLSDLAPDDRITFGAKTFDIKLVKNTDERDIQLEVFAKQHI